MHKLVKKGQNGISFRDPNYKIILSDEQKAYLNRPTEENYNRQLNDTKIKERNQTNYNRFSNVVGAAGGLFSGLYDAIPTADDDINGTDQDVAQLRGKTAQMMMQSGNPWLMAAGATVGVLDKTGAFGDATEGLGGAADFGNAAAAYLLPGVGWMKGLETDKYKISEALGTSSGYQGSRTFAEKAQKNAGARFLFGRKKANNMIADAKLQDQQVQGILSDAKNDFAIQNNMSEINGLRIQNITSGGNQMMRAARKGMRVLTQDEVVKRVEEIKKHRKGSTIDFKPVDKKEEIEPKEESQTTIKFQNGGQMNVIPDGALHARLHHMEDENPDLKGQITKKGIPVVSEEEGGEITQQAEIEREEIIFNKETTTALEELYNKYKEDPKPEYAIYAGKILAQQIMENTDDRTGLIDRVE